MVEVNVTTIIPADVERVWAIVRDFNAMPLWHPLIKESRIEAGAPSDQVGCVRNFKLDNGNTIREKLLSLSDIKHSFSYEILDSPMPLWNYVAGMQLHSTPGVARTHGHWKAQFQCDPKDESDMIELISNGVFKTGFDAVISRFS